MKVYTMVGVSTVSLNEAVANAHVLLEKHCSKAQITQIATAVDVAVVSIGHTQYTFTMTVVDKTDQQMGTLDPDLKW